ncbi:hypothetical protein L873DRAFT_1819534 [Choiromyces venosus 120613-1]|uniref:Uncharacterized protein n=1 Tax=Choiromyces venosus 120613-1 TaxID=1336337 RepID=A0A3N4JBZ3_9PEZI|nr:hypothetical protein L873DRAFT_1819534 [Choiromyces venosus 120613-1]
MANITNGLSYAIRVSRYVHHIPFGSPGIVLKIVVIALPPLRLQCFIHATVCPPLITRRVNLLYWSNCDRCSSTAGGVDEKPRRLPNFLSSAAMNWLDSIEI